MFVRKLFFLFLILLFFFAGKDVFAYDIETHAYLTDETINFSGNSQAAEFRNFLLDGSRREDDGIRSLNHFYDPVNNVGFHDAALGTWEKSKDWADDSANQNGAKYKIPAVIASILSAIESGKISDISAETDFTWHRAIELYANGEKEKAFFLLGHVIHLIEDASVPDHTRNDSHPGTSPYENWTAQFNLSHKDSGLITRLFAKGSIQLDRLGLYFDQLARYSNNNFYSGGTIGLQSGYKLPEPDHFSILEDGKPYGIKKDDESGEYPILASKGIFASNNENSINRPIIMSAYWSRLSTKAVQYGAGIINLFIKEAEAAKNDPNRSKQPEQKSFIASIADGAQGMFSAVGGVIQRAVNVLESVLKTNGGGQNEIVNKNPPQESLPQAQESQLGETISEPPKNDVSAGIAADESADQASPKMQFENRSNENAEQIQASPESALSDAEGKAAITRMLGQLDSMKNQAVELKNRIEAASGHVDETKENKTTSSSSGREAGGSSASNFTGGGGGGGNSSNANDAASSGDNKASRSYLKLIISEIQLASASSSRDEFLELYNPNQTAVDLTDWYIQKKTASSSSFSTFVPKTLLAGKSVPALGYFLVAHSSSTFSADVFSDYGLADNNSVALKNPNGEIASKVGWGAAGDCEGACASNPSDGQSIQRKWLNGTFSDTDNNGSDFEIQTCPSPKAQTKNCGAVEPAPAATSTSSATTSTVPAVVSGTHVLISEIMAGESGSADNEWIELYNPTDQATSLNGWSLKRKSSFAATSTSNLVAAGSFSGSIASKRFFLIASQSWSGSKNPDLHYSQVSNYLAYNEDVVLLYDSTGDLIDEVSYSGIGSGKSLERKAKPSGTCVSSFGAGEFLGNGCEATSTDAFEIRAVPNPQNSASLPEPRVAPVVSGAAVSYSSSSVSLAFRWNESSDASGATSSIVYEIKDASSSVVFATTTGALSLNKGIKEIGRDYDFVMRAVDRDGLSSATSSLSVSVPSFFDKFYFYDDPRSPGRKALDAYYSSYPFVPGRTDAWKMVFFYLDSEPSSDLTVRSDSTRGRYMPSGTSTPLSINYPRCSGYTSPDRYLLSPDNGGRCSVFGGGLNPVSFTIPEDKHFVIFPDDSRMSSVSTSSYVTAAFYDFGENWPSYNSFDLMAVDKQQYHFRESAPSSSAPFPPLSLAIQLDELHSSLSLSWPQSTDPDTIDIDLSYEVNDSTSTEFSTNTWRSVGHNLNGGVSVIFGNSYKVGVRAVDDFGNISSSTEKNWSFPNGFTPLPYQGNSSDKIGNSDGSGQRILTLATSTISRVAMVMANGPGAYSVTDTYIEIHADNNGGRGDVIATSTDINYTWPMSDRPMPREFVFNFPQPVNLSANTYYWLVPRNGPGISNQNFIYGSSTDAYPDGYWSGSPAADAYFFIR